MLNNNIHYNKYIKYKEKYISLNNLYGGVNIEEMYDSQILQILASTPELKNVLTGINDKVKPLSQSVGDKSVLNLIELILKKITSSQTKTQLIIPEQVSIPEQQSSIDINKHIDKKLTIARKYIETNFNIKYFASYNTTMDKYKTCLKTYKIIQNENIFDSNNENDNPVDIVAFIIFELFAEKEKNEFIRNNKNNTKNFKKKAFPLIKPSLVSKLENMAKQFNDINKRINDIMYIFQDEIYISYGQENTKIVMDIVNNYKSVFESNLNDTTNNINQLLTADPINSIKIRNNIITELFINSETMIKTIDEARIDSLGSLNNPRYLYLAMPVFSIKPDIKPDNT